MSPAGKFRASRFTSPTLGRFILRLVFGRSLRRLLFERSGPVLGRFLRRLVLLGRVVFGCSFRCLVFGNVLGRVVFGRVRLRLAFGPRQKTRHVENVGDR